VFLRKDLLLKPYFGENSFPFGLDAIVGCWYTSELGKGMKRVVVSLAHDEPSRRVWEEMNTETD
jgi:hypothetical protein